MRKIGLKMREWRFKELSSWISQGGRGHVPHSNTHFPQESAPLVKIFCLTGHKINGPLPTGLKFKEKIVKTSKNVVEMLAIVSPSTKQ